MSYENLTKAVDSVKSNKGSGGVDGLSIAETVSKLSGNLVALVREVLIGRYKVSPVRSVEIPKPSGEARQLGIPMVQDRIIQ